MKRLSQLLARLYPAKWRERYGDEFDALIEDSRASWRSTFDILRGALKLRALTAPSFRAMAVVLATFGVITAWVVRYELISKPVPIEIRAVDHVPASVPGFEMCVQAIGPDNCGFRGDASTTALSSFTMTDKSWSSPTIEIFLTNRIARECSPTSIEAISTRYDPIGTCLRQSPQLSTACPQASYWPPCSPRCAACEIA